MDDNEHGVINVKFTREDALAYIKGNNRNNSSESIIKGVMNERKFNWCAFFFGFMYCIYRKCYTAALSFIGIYIISAIPDYILAGNSLGVVMVITYLIVSVVFGFLFYPLYRRDIINEKSKHINLCAEHSLKELKKRGGTSPKALFITIFFLFASIMFVFLFLMVESEI